MLRDFNNFLHIIYAYMVTFTLFVYLFNPNKNTEIYTVHRKSAKKYRDVNFCSYCPALLSTSLFTTQSRKMHKMNHEDQFKL